MCVFFSVKKEKEGNLYNHGYSQLEKFASYQTQFNYTNLAFSRSSASLYSLYSLYSLARVTTDF